MLMQLSEIYTVRLSLKRTFHFPNILNCDASHLKVTL